MSYYSDVEEFFITRHIHSNQNINHERCLQIKRKLNTNRLQTTKNKESVLTTANNREGAPTKRETMYRGMFEMHLNINSKSLTWSAKCLVSNEVTHC